MFIVCFRIIRGRMFLRGENVIPGSSPASEFYFPMEVLMSKVYHRVWFLFFSHVLRCSLRFKHKEMSFWMKWTKAEKPGSATEVEVRPPNMHGFRFHVWPPKVVWPATYKWPSVGWSGRTLFLSLAEVKLYPLWVFLHVFIKLCKDLISFDDLLKVLS